MSPVVPCSNFKADLTSSFALQMDEDSTSLESGALGSGIPAGTSQWM